MASRTQRAAPVLGAALLGLVVALPFSWRPSLWTDEAATISAASRSLPQLFAMAHNIDAVHATYYALMHGWLLVVPPDAFLLRLPSAVAVALATAGVYLIAARLAGTRTAALAAVAFVMLPRTTWMGVEARPYALSALLAVAATWLLLVAVSAGATDGAVQTRRPGLLLVAYAVVVGLGMAVHIFLALILVAHGVSLLLSPEVRWRLRWGFGAAGLAAVALASPVIWTAVHQTGQLGGGTHTALWWIRNVVANQWFLGETPTLSTGGDASSASGLDSLWKPGALALSGVCWLVVLLGMVSRRRCVPLLRWALPWIVVPTLVISAYSIGVHNVYNPRYFSYAAAGLALLIGHGLAGLRASRVLIGVLVVIAILAAPVYVSQRQVNAKSSSDWSQAAAFVARHRSAGGTEGVYFGPRYARPTVTVAQTARGVAVAYPDAFAGLRDVTLLETPVAEANLTGTSLQLTDATERLGDLTAVWVVRRHDSATTTPDDATLVAAGFRPALRWSGPLDTVTQFVRS